MTIRNLDESAARVSRHVASDRFQQTLPRHVHMNADTFQTRVCFLSSHSLVCLSHRFHSREEKERLKQDVDDGDRL